MTTPVYVSTTIPYVNAPPHIGFALELVQADAIARYYRLVGQDVRFQTGTDENAFKNVLSARALGVPVRQLVDDNARRFRGLADSLGCSHDRFVRTTDPEHRRAVHAFLGRLRTDDVYLGSYRGLYCAGCEDFYLERDVQDGGEGGRCPEHGQALVAVAEQNYFFRLSAYGARVRELIASRRIRILPETREAEVLRFIDRGLSDISLSRSATRSGGWGVPYPGDAEHVVYVWIDALVNYLSGLGFPDVTDVERYWGSEGRRLHVIGKNVWKFHAIYWPALLLSAGLAVPDVIVVHGFLTSDGQKISKSGGDAPDPHEYIRDFGADAVRFYLLRHVRPFDDTDFARAGLAAAYLADLANGLGNLFSRLTSLCEEATLPGLARAHHAPAAPVAFHSHVESFRCDLALGILWDEIRLLNRAFTSERPWEDLRSGRSGSARDKLAAYAERLDALAYWLQPFLPATATTIRCALTKQEIKRSHPLFPRATA